MLGHYFIFGQPILTINQTADIVEVDQQQNIYLVQASVLKKFSPTGELQYTYSQKITGIITAIDVSNPLKIMVFFKESNSIAFLNQHLSPIGDVLDVYGKIDLELAIAGLSSKAGFWAYNNDKQSLLHINDKWEIETESVNLSGWINGEDLLFIREHNQKLYVGLKAKVLVFDAYGSYLTTIHFKGAQSLTILGSTIIYKKNNNVFTYNLNTRNEEEVVLKYAHDIQSEIIIDKTRYYEISNHEIKVFTREDE